MKAKFVLLAVIVGAIVAPINAHAESIAESSASPWISAPHTWVALIILSGIILLLVLIPSSKKAPVEKKQESVKETKKSAFVPSFVPKQDPIPASADEPGCLDGDLQSQSAVAQTAEIVPKTEPVPVENSNVPAQASIPYLENPTLLELREIVIKMDIYFIPFLRTISLKDSDVMNKYKCIAVFDRSNTIPLIRQIPRVLLEEKISGDQGYVLRSSLLNWKDLPHELRNILLKTQEEPAITD